MNFLSNMKITHRLVALLAILMLGLITIALTFYYFETQQVSSIQKQTKYLEFSTSAESAKINLLQAIRYEQLFLAENNKEHIDTHTKFITKAKEIVREMKKQALDDAFTVRLNEIEKELNNYHSTATSVFESALELGYGVDENTGTVGEMREYVHSIEDILQEVNQSDMMVSMLMMRRHEKDFQIREKNKYLDEMKVASNQFKKQVATSNLKPEVKENLDKLLSEYLAVFTKIVSGTNVRNRHTAESNEAVTRIEPIVQALVMDSTARAVEVKEKSAATVNSLNSFFVSVLSIISCTMIGAMLMLAKSINNPLSHFLQIINEISAGKTDVRVERDTKDEIGELSRAFDYMLNERQQASRKAEKEAEDLNESIIGLMEAAADLSERDFTIRVPVAENITGTVSDALNMMTNRVSAVLLNIRTISQEVKSSAQTVQAQAKTVTNLAAEERSEVERTMLALTASADSMNEISKLAEGCQKIANSASEFTGRALSQVLDTAVGINEIRTTISETEKRIKRLGERSQEISSVVEIINNVAIQTQVLALNASMQAAAAGEAGRGFSVVADEVQRLAKSSRESTSEISSLVTNIQTETAETMSAMNKAIAQVIEGTKMAEKSGEQMRETQKTTSELAFVVTQVAENADKQAKLSNKLKEESLRIAESTEKTSAQLLKQTEVTDLLVIGSQRLNDSVAEFKLRA